MRTLEWTGVVILPLLIVAACATARAPVTDVPPGTYELVEPESDVYNAVAITDRAFTVRIGDQVHSGEHWVDDDGRLRMADLSGPCAGEESIWTYSYASNRVTLNLVEDRCNARPEALPQMMVYERR